MDCVIVQFCPLFYVQELENKSVCSIAELNRCVYKCWSQDMFCFIKFYRTGVPGAPFRYLNDGGGVQQSPSHIQL